MKEKKQTVRCGTPRLKRAFEFLPHFEVFATIWYLIWTSFRVVGGSCFTDGEIEFYRSETH